MWYDLAIYSLKVGACLAVFYLFFKLLLSRETFHRFNRIVVLGAIVLSVRAAALRHHGLPDAARAARFGFAGSFHCGEPFRLKAMRSRGSGCSEDSLPWEWQGRSCGSAGRWAVWSG